MSDEEPVLPFTDFEAMASTIVQKSPDLAIGRDALLEAYNSAQWAEPDAVLQSLQDYGEALPHKFQELPNVGGDIVDRAPVTVSDVYTAGRPFETDDDGNPKTDQYGRVIRGEFKGNDKDLWDQWESANLKYINEAKDPEILVAKNAYINEVKEYASKKRQDSYVRVKNDSVLGGLADLGNTVAQGLLSPLSPYINAVANRFDSEFDFNQYLTEHSDPVITESIPGKLIAGGSSAVGTIASLSTGAGAVGLGAYLGPSTVNRIRERYNKTLENTGSPTEAKAAALIESGSQAIQLGASAYGFGKIAATIGKPSTSLAGQVIEAAGTQFTAGALGTATSNVAENIQNLRPSNEDTSRNVFETALINSVVGAGAAGAVPFLKTSRGPTAARKADVDEFGKPLTPNTVQKVGPIPSEKRSLTEEAFDGEPLADHPVARPEAADSVPGERPNAKVEFAVTPDGDVVAAEPVADASIPIFKFEDGSTYVHQGGNFRRKNSDGSVELPFQKAIPISESDAGIVADAIVTGDAHVILDAEGKAVLISTDGKDTILHEFIPTAGVPGDHVLEVSPKVPPNRQQEFRPVRLSPRITEVSQDMGAASTVRTKQTWVESAFSQRARFTPGLPPSLEAVGKAGIFHKKFPFDPAYHEAEALFNHNPEGVIEAILATPEGTPLRPEHQVIGTAVVNNLIKDHLAATQAGQSDLAAHINNVLGQLAPKVSGFRTVAGQALYATKGLDFTKLGDIEVVESNRSNEFSRAVRENAKAEGVDPSEVLDHAPIEQRITDTEQALVDEATVHDAPIKAQEAKANEIVKQLETDGKKIADEQNNAIKADIEQKQAAVKQEIETVKAEQETALNHIETEIKALETKGKQIAEKQNKTKEQEIADLEKQIATGKGGERVKARLEKLRAIPELTPETALHASERTHLEKYKDTRDKFKARESHPEESAKVKKLNEDIKKLQEIPKLTPETALEKSDRVKLKKYKDTRDELTKRRTDESNRSDRYRELEKELKELQGKKEKIVKVQKQARKQADKKAKEVAGRRLQAQKLQEIADTIPDVGRKRAAEMRIAELRAADLPPTNPSIAEALQRTWIVNAVSGLTNLVKIATVTPLGMLGKAGAVGLLESQYLVGRALRGTKYRSPFIEMLTGFLSPSNALRGVTLGYAGLREGIVFGSDVKAKEVQAKNPLLTIDPEVVRDITEHDAANASKKFHFELLKKNGEYEKTFGTAARALGIALVKGGGMSAGYVYRLIPFIDSVFRINMFDGFQREAAAAFYNKGLKEGLTEGQLKEYMYDQKEMRARASKFAAEKAKDFRDNGMKFTARDEMFLAEEVYQTLLPRNVNVNAAKQTGQINQNIAASGVTGLASQMITSVMQGIAIAKIPGVNKVASQLQTLIPFVNNIAQMMGQSLELTPAGALVGLQKAERLNRTEHERHIAMASSVVGTAFVGTLAYWWSEEQKKPPEERLFDIRATGGSNKAANDAYHQSGGTDWSIVLANKIYIPFSESPLVLPLAPLAIYADMHRDGKKPDSGVMGMLSLAGFSYASSLGKISMLRGLEGITDALGVGAKDPEKGGMQLSRTLLNIGKNYIPANGLLRTVSRYMNSPVDAKNDMWSAVAEGLTALPGMDGDPSLNLFGEPLPSAYEQFPGSLYRIYSTTNGDLDIRWLKNNGYTIPGIGHMKLDAGERADTNIEDPLAKLEYDTRKEILKLAGPEMRSTVADYRKTYSYSAPDPRVQKDLRKDINRILSDATVTVVNRQGGKH